MWSMGDQFMKILQNSIKDLFYKNKQFHGIITIS